MKDLKCEKLNTTKFCSAIKMSKRKSKTNRTLNALRKNVPTRLLLDLRVVFSVPQWAKAKWPSRKWDNRRQLTQPVPLPLAVNELIKKERPPDDPKPNKWLIEKRRCVEYGKPIKSYIILKHLAKYKNFFHSIVYHFLHFYYYIILHAKVFFVIIK